MASPAARREHRLAADSLAAGRARILRTERGLRPPRCELRPRGSSGARDLSTRLRGSDLVQTEYSTAPLSRRAAAGRLPARDIPSRFSLAWRTLCRCYAV